MEEGMNNNINMNNNENDKSNNTGIIIIIVIFAILIAIGILSYYLYFQFMNRLDFGSDSNNTQPNKTVVVPAKTDIDEVYSISGW